MKQAPDTTHEQFIQATRDAVVARALQVGTITDEEATNLAHAKLVYGLGDGSYRGVCHYEAWENGIGKVAVVEIAATAEESWVQLTGTTIHELGHVLAGWGAGHGTGWKEAAQRLGLRRPEAAGQRYLLAGIDPVVRLRASELAVTVGDGSPAFRRTMVRIGTVRPCSAGVGTRGGKSRGAGSGSRMVKVTCEADTTDDVMATPAPCGYTVRTTRKWLDMAIPECPLGHGTMTVEGDR